MDTYVSIIVYAGDTYPRSFIKLIDESHLIVLEKISKIFKEIDESSGPGPRLENWDIDVLDGKLTNDEISIVNNYIPDFDEYVIDTICAIEIIKVESIKELYN